MEKQASGRKLLRRKYKRYAAAVAGAAILTGAALPGIPVAKAAAAERATASSPVKYEYSQKVHRDKDRDDGPLRGSRWYDRYESRSDWHQHRHSWPSSDENRGWVDKDGRIYYRSDTSRLYDRYVYYGEERNPLEVVRSYAANYGFDRDRDTFRIIALSSRKATVQVTKNNTGERYIVSMERSYNHGWSIVAIYR